jgi:hypothetical protein
MKENKLTIRIKRPIGEIFDFTTNPQSTPCWIDTLLQEEVNEKEVGVGTQYTNMDKEGVSNSYRVTQFKKDNLFELESLSSPYHVRYTYTSISRNETELEYLEWDETGLKNPFKQEVLEKLKAILEV